MMMPILDDDGADDVASGEHHRADNKRRSPLSGRVRKSNTKTPFPKDYVRHWNASRSHSENLNYYQMDASLAKHTYTFTFMFICTHTER